LATTAAASMEQFVYGSRLELNPRLADWSILSHSLNNHNDGVACGFIEGINSHHIVESKKQGGSSRAAS